MESIQIREVEEKDLGVLNDLLKELNETIDSPKRTAVPEASRIYREMNRSPAVYANYVAVASGKVVGFLSMILYKTFLHTGGTALVNELIVAGGVRGKGVGKKLIARAILAAKQKGMDELEVGTELTNKNAQEFYRKCGFEQEYLLLGMELRRCGRLKELKRWR